jgi:hypothetical protein
MKKLLYLLPFVVTMAAQAQNTLRPNLYFQNQTLNYYNPAAGLNSDETDRALTFYGKYKSVASSVWDKPMTVWLNYIGRTKGGNGFKTLSFVQDNYSFFNRSALSAGYTRSISVLNTRRLSFGGRAVLNFDRLRWDEAPQFGQTGSATRFSPDLDLGAQFDGERLRLGLSIKNVLASTVKLDEEILLKNQREAYLNASFALLNGENFRLSPYGQLQLSRDFGVDLGAYLSFYRRLHVSYLFQLSELRSVVTAEVNLTKALRIGFAAGNSSLYRDTDLDFLVGVNF